MPTTELSGRTVVDRISAGLVDRLDVDGVEKLVPLEESIDVGALNQMIYRSGSDKLVVCFHTNGWEVSVMGDGTVAFHEEV